MFFGHPDPEPLLSIMESKMSDFRRLGADEFGLMLEVIHDGQCNFELEEELLSRVAQLELGMAISTSEDKDAFPPDFQGTAD